MLKKTIDTNKCNSCMACERICTNSRVIAKNEQGYPEFKKDFQCIFCGHCLAICPKQAIFFEWVNDKSPTERQYVAPALPLNGVIPPEEAILDFLYSSRSNRYFLAKPVEREKISKVLEAMVRAPSAGNEQNRNFYIMNDQDKIAKLEEQIREHSQKTFKVLNNPFISCILSFLSAIHPEKKNPISNLPFKQRYQIIHTVMMNNPIRDNDYFSFLRNANTLIIVTTAPNQGAFHKNFYKGDVCIAVTYGILAAKALGLASCWMGLLEIAGNQNPKIRDFLKINPGERIDGALVLGYSDLQWKQIPPRGPVKVVWME